MDSGCGQSSENKRKSPSDHKVVIGFRVFWHQNVEGRSLKLAKPNEPTWDKALVLNNDYPNVCTKVVNAENEHAFYIMHNLIHKNIMCMRALATPDPKKGDELSAVIHECNGKLHNSKFWSVFALTDGFIPSPTFQDVIKEIIDGADFLWRNGTYHGNLSWDTTHFVSPYTVKLYGFKSKDLSLEEAQWQDWDDIIAMLEVAVAEATSQNAVPGLTRVYDELEALIDTMKASARVNVNPLAMRESIFQEVFFWNTKNRAKLCMITIAELLNNKTFTDLVNASSICPARWYCSNKKENLTAFERLVDHCNDYRQKLDRPVPIFKEKSKMDFVRFIYAAYTHRSQIMKLRGLNVDVIIRRMFPRLFVELNRIVKQIVN